MAKSAGGLPSILRSACVVTAAVSSTGTGTHAGTIACEDAAAAGVPLVIAGDADRLRTVTLLMFGSARAAVNAQAHNDLSTRADSGTREAAHLQVLSCVACGERVLAPGSRA